MNCCRTNRQSSYDPEACSGSGSRSLPGTCSELVLLVGLHNFFNLDLMHRGWFKLSIDLSVVDGGSGEGSTSKRRGRANRSLPLAECEVELAMDSPGNPSASSSPEKGGEMPSEKKDHHGDGPPRKSHAHGKDLRTFSAPFYIEYIEQDVLIQKTVLYRITLKHHSLLESANVELDFTLHHAAAAEDSKPGQELYTPAATERITLCNLFNVQQYFVPLHFEKSFLSLTNVTIFASLGGLIKSERRMSNNSLNLRNSLDSLETDSWSSFLSLRSAHTPSKEQEHHFGSTITEEDLRKEPPSVLRELIARLQETLSQLFVLESVIKSNKQMSGNISEFRQNLMSLPSPEAVGQASDPAQLSKEVMKILIELRKLCRFAIMQHTSPAQNMISFLFEHWRASRYKVWSKYIQHQQSLNYDRKLLTTSGSRKLSTGNGSYHGSMGSICSDTASSDGPNSHARKLSKIDIIHQMYYTHEKFSPKTCPTIITDQPTHSDYYNPEEEPPVLDVLRLHEFPEFVADDRKGSATFLNFLTSDNHRPKHIIFFVHGFMGGPQDLRFFHSFLKLRYPHVVCHYSKENFKKTGSSFEDMGRRLAREVRMVVERLKPDLPHKGSTPSTPRGGDGRSNGGHPWDSDPDSVFDAWAEVDGLRISFVGHSIGNVIVRAALLMSEMRPLLRFLWTFLSVSGPHTGFQGVNAVQKAALLFLTKIRKMRSICELNMCEQANPRESFLFKLSKAPTFAHFKYVLLLGSKQDGYVPPGSATMTKMVKVARDGKLHGDLVDNFIKEV